MPVPEDPWPFPGERPARRPYAPHHPPPSTVGWPADYPTRPVNMGTSRPVIRPVIVRNGTTMRRWRRLALWGIPAAFMVGMILGAVLTGHRGADRPSERLTLVTPLPTTTAAPTVALQGARRLPDGRVIATLADGRVIIGRPLPGRVIVNGEPRQYGPTWGDR